MQSGLRFMRKNTVPHPNLFPCHQSSPGGPVPFNNPPSVTATSSFFFPPVKLLGLVRCPRLAACRLVRLVLQISPSSSSHSIISPAGRHGTKTYILLLPNHSSASPRLRPGVAFPSSRAFEARSFATASSPPPRVAGPRQYSQPSCLHELPPIDERSLPIRLRFEIPDYSQRFPRRIRHHASRGRARPRPHPAH